MKTSSDRSVSRFPARDDIFRRIGGPNAISWPSFGLTLGFTIVLAGIGAPAADAGWLWIVPALVGQTMAYVVLWAVKRTVLRTTRSQPRPKRTIAAFAIAAFVGGNASGAVAQALFRDDAADSAPANGAVAVLAILATVISFTIVASFAAVIVDAYREHTSWTSERNTKLQRLGDLRSNESALLESVRRQQRALVLDELESLRREIPQRAFDELSAEFRIAAFEVFRPLSHRLANSSGEEIPATPPVPPDFREFLADAVAHRPIRPLSLALLSSIASGFLVLFNTSFRTASTYIAMSLLVMTVVGVLLSKGLERLHSTSRRLTIGAVGLVLLSSCPSAIAFALLDDGIAGRASVTASFSVIAFGALGPILNAGRRAFVLERRDRTLLESALAREESLFRRNDHFEREKLSKIVHGRVQSTLLACALRLSSSDPNSNEHRDEIATRSWLSDTVQQLVECVQLPVDAPDLTSGLAEIESLWRGICVINYQVDRKSKTRLSEAPVSAVLAIIEELCTNAIRHGGARTIRCRVRWRSPEIVEVEVASDSRMVENATTRGLGSTLLDDLTVTWSIHPTEEGSRIVATVPIAERQLEAASHTLRHTS